jgi:hypothetical protein
VTERSTVEILRAARERISDPERWTQGSFARSANDEPISPFSSRASCWCARGALYWVCASVSGAYGAERFLEAALVDLEVVCDPAKEAIAQANDGGTHDDVLALYDRAISLAEEASC